MTNIIDEGALNDALHEFLHQPPSIGYIGRLRKAIEVYKQVELDKATVVPVVVGREIKLYPDETVEPPQRTLIEPRPATTEGWTTKQISVEELLKLYPNKTAEPPEVPEKLIPTEGLAWSDDSPQKAINQLIDCVNYLMNRGRDEQLD